MMEEQKTEEIFNVAVRVIRSLPKDGPYKPSYDMMTKFYGLYKQATEGPCKEPKPYFYEVVKGFKWKAWSSLGNMSKSEAKKTYVEGLIEIVETMAYSENIDTFMEGLGPYYDFVDLISDKLTDNTKKIIYKHIRSESPDEETNYEMVSMYNGEGNKPKLNGTLSFSVENLGVATDKNITSEVGSTSVKKKKYYDKSDRGRDPHLHLMNGDSPLVNETKGRILQNTTEISLNHEIESSSMENGIKSTHSYALKKMTSDTESDEEYLEPAETPEILQEKQRQRGKRVKMNAKNAHQYDSDNLSTNNYRGDSPSFEIVTTGGGDLSNAGRIRMTHAHQTQQGSYRSRGSRNSSVELTPPSNPNLSGDGDRRRRRDSEEHRSNVNMDVNVQLVYILKKIHQDLEAVVLRLDSIESQALNQNQNVCALCRRRLEIPSSLDMIWWLLWPFPELSARSTFFLLTWPLTFHVGLKFLQYLRARRLRKLASVVRVKAV